MRPASIRLFIFLLSLVVISCSATNHLGKGIKSISPNDYGFAQAKTDVDRYQVLLKTQRSVGSQSKCGLYRNRYYKVRDP